MDSEHFGMARDLLYLAFLFAGAAAGSFLNCFRVKASTRFRGRSVTVGLLLLTGTVAFFAVQLILTGGELFTELEFYITGVILTLVACAALRFPRAAGFPLVLVAGAASVWLACSFLRFPRLDRAWPLGSIEVTFTEGVTFREGDTEAALRVVPENDSVVFPVDVDAELTLIITSAEFRAFFPVAGGEPRGKITELRAADKVLYRDTVFETWLPTPGRILSAQTLILPVPTDSLVPGRALQIFFDGENPVIR